MSINICSNNNKYKHYIFLSNSNQYKIKLKDGQINGTTSIISEKIMKTF